MKAHQYDTFRELINIKNKIFLVNKKILIKELKNISLSILISYIDNNNIFLIFLSILFKKIEVRLKQYEQDLGESHYDELFNDIKDYIKQTPKTEVPSCENKDSIITFLYVLTEEAIIQNNLQIIIILSKIYLFEQTHLRLCKIYDNKEMLKVLIKGYDNVYDLVDFDMTFPNVSR